MHSIRFLYLKIMSGLLALMVRSDYTCVSQSIVTSGVSITGAGICLYTEMLGCLHISSAGEQHLGCRGPDTFFVQIRQPETIWCVQQSLQFGFLSDFRILVFSEFCDYGPFLTGSHQGLSLHFPVCVGEPFP